MSKTKKQHTVPRAYLQRFANKNKNSWYSWVYDKKTESIYKGNIENIAEEKDFYTLDRTINKLAWEEYYANNIEPLINPYIGKLVNRCLSAIINDRATVINHTEKAHIALIMSVQLSRGPTAREHIQQFAREFSAEALKELEELFGSDNTEVYQKIAGLLQYDSPFLKVAMADAITNGESTSKIARRIADRVWIVYRISGDMEFITSDNPVMFLDLKSNNSDPFIHGLNSIGTVVHFPIASKLMIAAYPKELFFSTLSDYDGKLVVLKASTNEAFINNTNLKQLSQCHRQVIAQSQETINKVVRELNGEKTYHS